MKKSKVTVTRTAANHGLRNVSGDKRILDRRSWAGLRPEEDDGARPEMPPVWFATGYRY
jgi:hypothetical protein